MKILIDNANGLGLVDYTPFVLFNAESKIIRRLNKTTSCTFELFNSTVDFTIPVRLGRVQIIEGDSSILFSGYIDSFPNFKGIGYGQGGPAYQAIITALSDDAALDSNFLANQAILTGQSLQQDWNILSALTTGASTSISMPQQLSTAGRMNLTSGIYWTEAAEALAGSTRTTYRANGLDIEVTSLGATSHTISADDPGLTFVSEPVKGLQWLANDVTVCGKEEPTAYVTEIFQGDGTTKSFELSVKPFSATNKHKTSIQDSFQGEFLNSRLWLIDDSAAHLALTADGLTCKGGSGKDHETTIGSTQLIEMGGTITIESTGVQISRGSAGIVLGLYVDTVSTSTCFAGFVISSAGTVLTLAAMIDGASAGESFALEPDHLYTLHLKVFCPEMQRIQQSYFYLSEKGAKLYGGNVVASSGQVELSIQDVVSGISGVPILIYSASISSLPATCRLGILNSGNLLCSLKSVKLFQAAPFRIGLGIDSSTPVNLVLGSTAEGASCKITNTGVLEFYPANIPAAGSLIHAAYRAKAKAVSRRMQNFMPTESLVPASTTWIGSVVAPSAWSSEDCDNAALALLSTATGLSAALKGSFKFNKGTIQKDIWPGDTLSIGPYYDNTYRNAIATNVTITLRPDWPDNAFYTIFFDNEQTESLSLHFSNVVPEDVDIPQQPTSLDKALNSLSKINVTSLSQKTITFDTGDTAPINGGFEVRRRDNTFGPGQDSDLVLRSQTPTISIPRLAAVEQYYIRTYDAQVPPNYSLFSAAIFINATL